VQSRMSLPSMTTEIDGSSVKMVTTYETTRCHNPEDHNTNVFYGFKDSICNLRSLDQKFLYSMSLYVKSSLVDPIRIMFFF
jgi:hypothetical protein